MRSALVQFVRERIAAMNDDTILALALTIDVEAASQLPRLDPSVINPRVPKKPRAQRAPKPETGAFTMAVFEAIAAGASGMMAIEQKVGALGTRAMIARALDKLKQEERVFQGGERRFARYATSQEDADRISYEARTGTTATE